MKSKKKIKAKVCATAGKAGPSLGPRIGIGWMWLVLKISFQQNTNDENTDQNNTK